MERKLLILFFIVLFLPLNSDAAEIFFGVNSKTFGVGEKFEVGVFLNTQDEIINALESDIIFNPDSLKVETVNSGGSIITLWLKQPKDYSDGKVSFSGVTPGGFWGNKGYLFSIVFKAEKEGKFTISSADEKIVINDGSGTNANISKAPLELEILEKGSSELFIEIDDKIPPEDFQAYVSKNDDIFSGGWFVSFNAQDKNSGIGHYEILERPSLYSIFGILPIGRKEWTVAESPYLLSDQELRSVILIKAVDNNGNSTISKVAPSNYLPWYENILIWLIIILIAVVVGYRLWNSLRKRN